MMTAMDRLRGVWKGKMQGKSVPNAVPEVCEDTVALNVPSDYTGRDSTIGVTRTQGISVGDPRTMREIAREAREERESQTFRQRLGEIEEQYQQWTITDSGTTFTAPGKSIPTILPGAVWANNTTADRVDLEFTISRVNNKEWLVVGRNGNAAFRTESYMDAIAFLMGEQEPELLEELST